MQELIKSELRYRRLFETAQDGILILDAETGMITDVNPFLIDMLGYSREEFVEKKLWEVGAFKDIEASQEAFEALQANEYIRYEDLPLKAKSGKLIQVEFVSNVYLVGDEKVIQCNIRDITKRKQIEAELLKAETYSEMGREILQILNEPGNLQDSIQRAHAILKTRTGFDAVGIRLQDGDDFPYLIQNGFPKDFLLTENTLIKRGADGGAYRDYNGNVRLECACGLVISGKTNPANPFFTQQGSFWTNDSFPFLDTPLNEDPRHNPRNQCMLKGYASLALVPIRNEENIFGLIQFNDRRKGCFTIGTVKLLEEIAAHIGKALMRKRAEEALLKAGALQNAIFNSANFSSIATDAKGVIQIFNVGAERMLGYEAADVLNKITPAEISDPQELIARAKSLSLELFAPITPGFEALVFKASRGIEDIYELTYIRKDGSRFPAVVSVTALRDAQEAIIGYLLIGTDNTARKQIEAERELLGQRLRDQQFYTRSLFEANIDALITTDPSGIITDVNKQMEALTGCTRDELIGAPFKRHFTDPEQAEASIKLVLSEKKVTNYELTARARNGRETVVSYNATTFYDRDRRLQGVFAAARDITERNRLDLVLQEKNIELEGARSVAEKASLAKSDFLSSMSHELRSPLNAILGFAQLMESDSPPPTPDQNQSIDQILQAGWHLLKLIDEILDLAKVESGQVPLSPEPVLLNEVLLECQGMIEPQAQECGIALIFPSFDTPYFVRADRTRVKQVLINLLSNAIKYNSQQGTVEVKCAESTPGRIRVSVRDTGAGLSPEQLEQLFQAFNRLGQETGDVEGTGIGLVVSKRLIELMGGVIGVESTVGVGSVFWFDLLTVGEPRLSIEVDDAATLIQAHMNREAGLRTLLYVEDNPANLKLIEQIIARHPDMRLRTAVSGNNGIEIARTSQPDVILMDINLPDINGFEALKVLRSDPATAHIPVVAISANAMPRDIRKGLEAGFLRYITKPIKIDEFMDALADALDFAGVKPEADEKGDSYDQFR